MLLELLYTQESTHSRILVSEDGELYVKILQKSLPVLVFCIRMQYVDEVLNSCLMSCDRIWGISVDIDG